jgi:AbiV family abortive infection protein
MAKSDYSIERAVAFVDLVQKAIDHGARVGGASAPEIFDAAAGHVVVLLGDAVDAFRRGSFGTSIFLALTAIEETAKAEIVTFRLKPGPDGPRCGRDPLRDHGQKHRLAIRETTFMGRLPDVLGPEACARLAREAESGGLTKLRESALYVNFDEHGVHAPEAAITRSQARELLLLALECADDILVGWTNASYGLRDRLDPWFTELAKSPA